MVVNERLSAPPSPGEWVDGSRCVCGATYRDYRSWPSWDEACQRVRANNPETDGGYRSRGPVLWAMRVAKLEAWYMDHYACGYLFTEVGSEHASCRT